MTTSTFTAAAVNQQWDALAPRYAQLEDAALSSDSIDTFLRSWSELSAAVHELGNRLYVATTVDTADEEAAAAHQTYLEQVFPRVQQSEQRLREKLLASGLEPEGFAVPLRQMRAETEVYREVNVPLQAAEQTLTQEYFVITGAQAVEWEGQKLTIDQARLLLQNPDRGVRERIWRLISQRVRADRPALNDLWQRLLANRRQQAANTGFPDYRAYAWQHLKRFDYTPDDAEQFHASVEAVVVPAVARLNERRRRQLGVGALRPWDLDVDPLHRPALRPFDTAEQLEEGTARVFHRVDPVLGGYFDTMRAEGLLDLSSRPNKAPGGYCESFPAATRPFIFANVAGSRVDVETLLHEGGHAFHVFSAAGQPYFQQRNIAAIGHEFNEVASMSMEFLAAPYLAAEQGGFYSPAGAARARIEHLEQRVLLLWARLAVYDLFQHWVYTHADDAADPARCDAVFAALYRRFVPGVDHTGLEDHLAAGWHDVLHVFVVPFYIIEYALALLGAVQIWDNARRDQAGAVARYRQALALGNTRTIPELFAAAGARFAFDRNTLQSAVSLIEQTIEHLSSVQ